MDPEAWPLWVWFVGCAVLAAVGTRVARELLEDRVRAWIRARQLGSTRR